MSDKYTITIDIDILVDNIMHEDASLEVCFEYNYEAPSWEHPGDDSIDLITVMFNDEDIFFKLTQKQYSDIADKCYELMPSRNEPWYDQP